MCISQIFSLCQRISSPSKLAVSQLWHWAEGEGWAVHPPSPLGGGKGSTGSLLFSHGGWKHGGTDMARMLRIALPSNFTHCQGKPECLSKGFGTELTSENSEIIKQRHIAPGWLSHTIPCPPEQGSASPPVADLLPVSCLQLIPISGEKWVDPGRDAQSPQRLIERGQSCHSAR